jgi:enamine deaminase RidA (YjgF/YER057c/UK114 family)
LADLTQIRWYLIPHNGYDPCMKLTAINSPAAPAAAGGYSQAVEVSGSNRLLFISGQIPENRSGDMPKDFRSQAKLAWANVCAQLEAAQMSATNLIKVTTFLSSREYAIENRAIRQAVLGGHAPALTVIITGIFDENWLIEIEAIAAA